MRIEVMEPGEAIPRGRGYVGVGDAGDEIFFPHVDSCCAVVVLYENGTIIGGHIGAQWPGHGVDRAFAGQQIIDLMAANQNRVNPGEITNLIVVYPGSTGWTPVVGTIYSTFYCDNFLDIDTQNCKTGADVLVTHTEVTLRDCKTNLSKTYAIEAGLHNLAFPSGAS